MTELRIHEITSFPMNLPLRSPFRTARTLEASRQTVLLGVEVRTPRGPAIGWGEAAALPAWGTERVAESRRLLAELTPPREPFDLQELDAVFPELRAAPAARFAVECALLDAHARTLDVPLRSLLSNTPFIRENHDISSTCRVCDTLRLNATLGADAGVQAARRVAEAGYDCLKLKVGAETIDADLARLRRLAAVLPAGLQLRLDANGAWSPAAARRFLGELGESLRGPLSHLLFEYVEQPVADLNKLLELAQLSPVPLAVDEAAHPLATTRKLVQRLRRPAGPSRCVQLTVVLKPMALGGLLAAREVARQLENVGARVVFTSTVESAVGRTAVAHLVLSRNKLAVTDAHGLATGEQLAADVCATLPPVRAGRLRVPDGSGLGLTIERDQLRALRSDGGSR